MKKLSIAFLILIAVITHSNAQESTDKTVFDYSATKHEFSLDLAPIILGQYPSNLLYRNHYVSKNGKNVALRLGAQLNADIGSSENESGNLNTVNRDNQRLNIHVGKEWQKIFQKKIIGYYGIDFGAGFSRSLFDVQPNDPNQLQYSQKSTFYNLNSTGFLGMRYHFSKHFSVSAETSAMLNFNTGTTKTTTPNVYENESNISGVGLSMSPLRAIRFAFHF
jgi:hypothetical protein